MTHHMLPEIDRGWLANVTNCFLIRDPTEMLPSYVKKNGIPTLADTGYLQQLELFELVRKHSGQVPPVIDTREFLSNPRPMLARLCDALGVAFADKMMSWPAGPRESDGIWASHWYPEVEETTGFQPYRPKNEPVPAELGNVFETCREIYRVLHEHCLH